MILSDNELRDNVIAYIKRCLTFGIKPCFENYYIKYDESNDTMELLYISNLINEKEFIVPNIFDKIGTDVCPYATNLRKIKFGNRLKVIGWGAFRYHHKKLKVVDLSECTDVIIEQEAFKIVIV